MPPRAVCPLAFPYPVLRSPAFPTSQPSREILPIAGQQNKRAVAVTNQQWLARACPPEFGSNHGLVWLMIGYSRDQPTSVPVRARSVDTLIADIAKRPPTGPKSAISGLVHRSKLDFHSINSSASASSVGDTSRPSDLAVLRLIRSLNVTGCCTGISPGLSPFSILSTTAAERRKISAWSGP